MYFCTFEIALFSNFRALCILFSIAGQASHLRNHIKNVHKKNLIDDPMEVNDFKCDSCEKIFESIRDLRRYINLYLFEK